jgi:hypothetical protein
MSWGYIGAAAITAGSAYVSNKKKKKGATQTTENSMPPWLESASENAVNRADELSRRAYTPFSGQRVAGLSANEQQAGRLATAFGDKTAARMRNGFQSSDLAQFENPYLDRVLANRKRAIGEEYGRQSADLSKRQSAMNAFRSGRSDLARSRLDANRMRALDEAEAEERSGAFDRAMGAYFQDQNQQAGAFETASRGLQSSGIVERSVRQAQNDFDYGTYLERRDWDVNNLTPLLNAISSARGGSMSQTSFDSGGNKDPWGAVGGMLGQAVLMWSQDNDEGGGTPGGGHTPEEQQLIDGGYFPET